MELKNLKEAQQSVILSRRSMPAAGDASTGFDACVGFGFGSWS